MSEDTKRQSPGGGFGPLSFILGGAVVAIGVLAYVVLADVSIGGGQTEGASITIDLGEGTASVSGSGAAGGAAGEGN